MKRKTKEEKLEALDKLLSTMDELREQCPWDRKQTMETLRPLTIEEVYELADAILEKQPAEIKKELGDVLLHLLFYARIGEEKGWFDIADVCLAEVEKLIERHPHIYGDTVVKDENDVKRNWEHIKQKDGRKSALEGVPTSLPALVKAIRLQEKAQGLGFDWEDIGQVLDKVKEELGEFEEQMHKEERNQESLEEEFGDLIFSMVNFARFLHINPDNALEKTNRKFIRRFQYMEEKIRESGKQFADMNLDEMDVFWNEAKANGL